MVNWQDFLNQIKGFHLPETVKVGLVGALFGNTGNASKAFGLYYTFMDRPFALKLALMNFGHNLLVDSATGALTPYAIAMVKKLISAVKVKNSNRKSKGARKRASKQRQKQRKKRNK